MKKMRYAKQHLKICITMLFLLSFPLLCHADVAGTAKKDISQSIGTAKKSHAERSKWEEEKAKLILTYEQLLQEKQILFDLNNELVRQEKTLETTNADMARKKMELVRVQKELGPFLNTVVEQLQTLLKTDPPFLTNERETRIARLSEILEDTGATIAEKYRKVMEAVFIEAEYGSTIEVYQDKIQLEEGSEQTLCNIFRLGRVSLFCLSLDDARCGTYNPGTMAWQILPESVLPAIRSAVEIGSKRRPAELLPLPVGRLALEGGAK